MTLIKVGKTVTYAFLMFIGSSVLAFYVLEPFLDSNLWRSPGVIVAQFVFPSRGLATVGPVMLVMIGVDALCCFAFLIGVDRTVRRLIGARKGKS